MCRRLVLMLFLVIATPVSAATVVAPTLNLSNTPTVNDGEPRQRANWVVYSEADTGGLVYRFNVETGALDNLGLGSHPDVRDDGLVAFVDNWTGYPGQIVLSDSARNYPIPDSWYGDNPSILDDWVVFERFLPSGRVSELVLYNLSSGDLKTIVKYDVGEAFVSNPLLHWDAAHQSYVVFFTRTDAVSNVSTLAFFDFVLQSEVYLQPVTPLTRWFTSVTAVGDEVVYAASIDGSQMDIVFHDYRKDVSFILARSGNQDSVAAARDYVVFSEGGALRRYDRMTGIVDDLAVPGGYNFVYSLAGSRVAFVSPVSGSNDVVLLDYSVPSFDCSVASQSAALLFERSYMGILGDGTRTFSDSFNAGAYGRRIVGVCISAIPAVGMTTGTIMIGAQSVAGRADFASPTPWSKSVWMQDGVSNVEVAVDFGTCGGPLGGCIVRPLKGFKVSVYGPIP